MCPDEFYTALDLSKKVAEIYPRVRYLTFPYKKDWLNNSERAEYEEKKEILKQLRLDFYLYLNKLREEHRDCLKKFYQLQRDYYHRKMHVIPAADTEYSRVESLYHNWVDLSNRDVEEDRIPIIWSTAQDLF